MLKLMASTAVVAMAVALSFSRNLDLQAEMIFATARSFLQLSLVGFFFHFIFSQKTAAWILLPNLFMVLVAGHTAGHRARLVPYGKWIAAASILVGTWATMSLPIALKIVPFSPRYIVPVTGMMVGHAMAVTGVAMKQLHEDVYQRNLVKTARAGLRPTIASASGLVVGVTPRRSTIQQAKRALVVALSPDLDSVKTFGPITLPGMMTGLIMAWASPVQAIKLRIVITNMLVGACVMSSALSTYLCLLVFSPAITN